MLKNIIRLKGFNHRLSRALYWITAITCALFLCSVLLAVVSRYLLKAPVIGSVELSRLFFLWSCFMAGALCFYNKSHIAITFIIDRLPTALIRSTQLLAHTLELVFFLWIFVKSIEVVSILWNTKLPMLGFSQAVLYLPVPVAMLAMTLFSLEFLGESISPNPANNQENALDTYS